MNYNAVLLEAVESLVKAYEAGSLRLYTEADLQSYLFHYCLKVLDDHQAVRPYPIHCNHSILAESRERVDLVLGENDVVADLKFEPDYPDLPASRKPVVFSEDILRDVERMRRYDEQGISFSYVIVLDEDGRHLRAFPNSPWKKLDKGEREAYLLVKRCRAGSSVKL